jgi:hypothetical protein
MRFFGIQIGGSSSQEEPKEEVKKTPRVEEISLEEAKEWSEDDDIGEGNSFRHNHTRNQFVWRKPN